MSQKNKFKEPLIADPLIVARDGNAVIFMARNDALQQPLDILANAQLYDLDKDVFSPLVPIGSFVKFMPYIQAVDPPEPFVRP